MPLNRKKCLVLLSGGIDSATALWWAKNRGWRLATLGFLFPGRRKMEIESARILRRLSGSSENFEVSLPFVNPPRSERSNYIPQKNLMYYAIASSIAENIGANCIIGGHFRHDGVVFRDARKSYLERIGRLIREAGGKGNAVQLLFPFIKSSKGEIVKAGRSMGAPFQYAWSCSNDGRKHCWKCNSCKERIQGFRDAGLKDPLYAPHFL